MYWRMGMELKLQIISILNQLGVDSKYKGYSYVISSLCFISENERDFLPITKILYAEIAKQFNTSAVCIEKDIRKVIEYVWWHKDDNNELIIEIFGDNNTKPTNKEFLLSLYKYILTLNIQQYIICPLSKKKCQYCQDLIEKVLYLMRI